MTDRFDLMLGEQIRQDALRAGDKVHKGQRDNLYTFVKWSDTRPDMHGCKVAILRWDQNGTQATAWQHGMRVAG